MEKTDINKVVASILLKNGVNDSVGTKYEQEQQNASNNSINKIAVYVPDVTKADEHIACSQCSGTPG